MKRFIVLLLELLTSSLSLLIASYLFDSIYVESFGYAILASIVISLISVYIKPLLEVITLPINILLLGFASPIVNVIILKIASLILGSHFVINGFIIPIFISIFISIINIILNNIIVDPIKERR